MLCLLFFILGGVVGMFLTALISANDPFDED